MALAGLQSIDRLCEPQTTPVSALPQQSHTHNHADQSTLKRATSSGGTRSAQHAPPEQRQHARRRQAARATAAARALAASAAAGTQRPVPERRARRLSKQNSRASLIPGASRGVLERRARRGPQRGRAARAGGQQRQHGGVLPN